MPKYSKYDLFEIVNTPPSYKKHEGEIVTVSGILEAGESFDCACTKTTIMDSAITSLNYNCNDCGQVKNSIAVLYLKKIDSSKFKEVETQLSNILQGVVA